MPVLIRAAVVGATLGVTLELFRAFGVPATEDGDDGLAFLGVILGIFILAQLLGWAAKVPWWPLVGALAPFAMFALMALPIAFDDWIPDNGVTDVLTLGLPVFTGYFLIAWLFAPGANAARAIALCAIIIACFAAEPVAGVLHDRERLGKLRAVDFPLVAPEIPGFQLDGLEEVYLPDTLSLEYHPDDPADQRWIEVRVAPAKSGTPKAVCAHPEPNWAWKSVEPCREAAPGVWTTRLENGYTVVYALHAGALVEVGGFHVKVEELVAVLPAFRPIAPERLVPLGRSL
ncbi:hypothetical protein DP939_17070 [Spongiactinospora rosea]|uniref:Uncharacterized protein n=1 Tax=Spongiactinospora rosea TaxID=2248750 RepID=A0A366LZY2_9ACTN|nr:hypothetical protein [Spongiactinospora rosea]RBQ18909.1 hypothetical protein DP939_17070 [Spongiactinospora rosea]